MPGLILTQENKVIFSPNLHSVERIPSRDELEPEIGLPLTVEDDAGTASWGEFWFGAGSDMEHLVFVTLGTSIGGSVISRGILLRGAQGSGGELGHMTIQANGPRCGCGNCDCPEALASGTAPQRHAREVANERADPALGKLAVNRQVLGEDVARLAREGDEAAIFVLEEAGLWHGNVLAGFVNIFNPEMVAGGGVAGELILEPARKEAYLRACSPSRDLVEIREATLGPESGVLGAAALACDPSSGEYVSERFLN